MAEDSFVQMLLEAAAGEVTDERDIGLARVAGRWALTAGGWQLHLHNGFYVPGEGMDRWVLVNRPDQRLEVRVRIAGADWRPHVSHTIAHVGHALDVLAAEDLLPARFSTLGRRALEGHAEVLERAAGRVREAARGEDNTLAYAGLVARAVGLCEAAESARRYAGAELAVLG